MTITTKKTICKKYIVSAEQNGVTFSVCDTNRQIAFKEAIKLCREAFTQ